METLKYNGIDVSSEFLSNAIEIKSTEATLPGIYGLEKTDWEMTEDSGFYFVGFSSKEKVFKEKFKITLYKEDGFIKMNLVSSTTYLKCSKSGM